MAESNKVLNEFSRGMARMDDVQGVSAALLRQAQDTSGSYRGILTNEAERLTREANRLMRLGQVNPPKNDQELRLRVKQDIAAQEQRAESRSVTMKKKETAAWDENKRFDLRKKRLNALSTATKNRLGIQTQPGVLGAKPLDVSSPMIDNPIRQLEQATTGKQTRAIRKGPLAAGVAQVQKGAGIKAGLGKAGLGGLGAAVAIPLLQSIFAKKDDSMNPAVQMALAQQMQGGGGGAGGGTSSTLRDMGRLLTMLKGLQDMAGMEGPAAQGPPRLV
jgi:hypothetical protein